VSGDGSFTLFSEEFNEHYHSTNDGALSESLYKHIIPALEIVSKKKLNILDINFGLGFNTFTTLYTLLKSQREVTIHSPEIDRSLVEGLKDFPYPELFKPIKHIIDEVVKSGKYESDRFKVYVHFGDAREFLTNYRGEKFDIVYQDAFSPKQNPTLWTKEYFKLIRDVAKCDSILTTYSTSTPVRLSLYENGFHIYTYQHSRVRSGTVASPQKLDGFIPVDMELKRVRSSNGKPLLDSDLVN
jgi:tRNA U34 5-methylaminomethyl-2-thiouridine-forming methyltransferase MnmC